MTQSYRAAWVYYPGSDLDSLRDTNHHTGSDAADRYVGASVVLIALVAVVIVVRVVVPRWSVTRYVGQVVALGGALVAAIAVDLVASDVGVIIAEEMPLGDREIAHGPGRTYANVGVALLAVAALATRQAKARRAWPVSRRGLWAMSAVAAGGCLVVHSYVATWSIDYLFRLYSLLGFDAPGRGPGWPLTYVVASGRPSPPVRPGDCGGR